MQHRDLRFFGFHIHEADGFKGAEACIKREMSERTPDKFEPGGYAADPKFKAQVSKFSDDIYTFTRDLLDRAKQGRKVTQDEIVTLERAEKLYATASAPGPETAQSRLALLASGRRAFGVASGMSDSRLIRKLSGLDVENHQASGLRINVDHGYRR